ncbi:hypothetical protein [Nocardiopsis valliformis]|uniref:hypothetical protein n=1 Tax=Nocardiopsis valliformis TaxID=239974 RepID=UPI0003760981|nr:hypothetical protein [Nocardiopsis valliformis]
MPRPSPLPCVLLAVSILTATACSVLPEDAPAAGPRPDSGVMYLEEHGYSPTSSEISPDEAQLCLPGEGIEGADGMEDPSGDDPAANDRTECESGGELRWSLPLEGDYFFMGYSMLSHPATGTVPTDDSRSRTGDFHAVATPAGLLYAENTLLRMVDPATGELLWTKDLHEEAASGEPEERERIGFLGTGLRSANATEDHLILHFEGGLIRLTQDGDFLDSVLLLDCQGDLEYASDQEVVLGNCGNNSSSIFRFDTGERTTGNRRAFDEDLTEAPLTSSLHRGLLDVEAVDEGPFTALATDYHRGPPGLGTIPLISVPVEEADEQDNGIAIAVACVPDGMGEASPEQPSPGVPCEGARLYAVNH